jgi:hypothetical protein
MAKIYLGGKGTMVSAENAKKIILTALRAGHSVEVACQSAGRSRSSYDKYRKDDREFAARADAARMAALGVSATNRKEIPDFPEFCQTYLDTTMFRHQLQWFDLLEGREPRDLRPNQRYVPGDASLLVINTPPDHSKTTTITENYVTWRVCQDPNIRVILVSKTEDMAKKFLKSIKDRLAESETYIKLQTDFGPFAEDAASWSANKIYVSGADSGEHTPTIQAIGIGGQIYGNRADLVIMDDCVLGSNAHLFAKQINWIQTEVVNRADSYGGRCLLIGTRLAPVDLYREIFKPEYYADEVSPWTLLTQPAVEEFAADPKDWVTLWPKSNRPPVSRQARALVTQDESGLWPRKDGTALALERRKTSARNWALVFQQEDVAEDSIFDPKDLQACTEERRYAGRMIAGQPGHRKFGMDGLYVVAGLDPAAVNYTAIVVVGLDRSTGKRYVINVLNKAGLLPHQLRQVMQEWTDKYGIQEWRVERNAFQQSIVQDIDLQNYMHARGCQLAGHHTDGKKWDVDFGVAAMALLFKNWEYGRQLIELPSRHNSEGSKALFEQLSTWFPETKGRTDTVMALWFAEIRCKELLAAEYESYHLSSSEFDTREAAQSRMVLDIDYALAQSAGGFWDGTMDW